MNFTDLDGAHSINTNDVVRRSLRDIYEGSLGWDTTTNTGTVYMESNPTNAINRVIIDDTDNTVADWRIESNLDTVSGQIDFSTSKSDITIVDKNGYVVSLQQVNKDLKEAKEEVQTLKEELKKLKEQVRFLMEI